MFADELRDNVADTGNGNLLNAPKYRQRKTCKGRLPNRTVTWWKARVLVMRIREHERLIWAVVCYTGIHGNPGMVEAAD